MPIKRKLQEASSWFPNQHTPSINRCGGKWNRVCETSERLVKWSGEISKSYCVVSIHSCLESWCVCLVKAKCVRVALPCGVSESCNCVIGGATLGFP